MPSIRSSSLLCVLFWAAFVANTDAIFLQDSACPADENENWTYRGDNGPNHWNETYPQCNGNHQSGIDINTAELKVLADAEEQQLNYVNYDQPITKARMENNGHTIEVIPDDGVTRTITVENQTYSLVQFHFHWGCKTNRGSEHTVNGKRYSMEMHLVHMTEDGQIAVVGVFFRERFMGLNAELEKLVLQFSEVQFKGEETEVKSSLDLRKLLPTNTNSFYRYDGSLTTPPCTEGVKWSVLTDPITVGFLQMTKFRMLSSATRENASQGCRLCDNFRPVQPLNDREVFLVQ